MGAWSCATATRSCRSMRAKRRAFCGARSIRWSRTLGDDNPHRPRIPQHRRVARRICRRTPNADPSRSPSGSARRTSREPGSRGWSPSGPAVGRAIDDAIRSVNGEPGRPESFDALHELLEAQPYRLAYWRTASHEINYRRFFDVNTLAGLRVENPDVFAATHQADRRADSRRQGPGASASTTPTASSTPRAISTCCRSLPRAVWVSSGAKRRRTSDRPLYVVAEKILSGGERLPTRWAVHGTTGYNFLNDLNGLFVDVAQARRMRRVYARADRRDGAVRRRPLRRASG